MPRQPHFVERSIDQLTMTTDPPEFAVVGERITKIVTVSRSTIVVLICSILSLAATFYSLVTCSFVHQLISQTEYRPPTNYDGGDDDSRKHYYDTGHAFRTIQQKEIYGLPRSPCLMNAKFFEYRLPRAIETQTVREHRIQYQQLEYETFQQQQQQRNQTKRAASSSSKTTTDYDGDEFKSSLQRNIFINPPDIQKQPNDSFDIAKNEAHTSWKVGLVSLVVALLVSIKFKTKKSENSDGDNPNHRHRRWDKSRNSSIQVLRQTLPIKLLLRIAQHHSVLLLAVTMIGFIVAANTNLWTLKHGVWNNQQLCTQLCASSIVRNQQQFIIRQQSPKRTTTAQSNPISFDERILDSPRTIMDVDVCIDGCELAIGGRCVMFSVLMWSCCAVITAWQFVMTSPLFGGSSSIRMTADVFPPFMLKSWIVDQIRRRRQRREISTKGQS